MSHEDRGPSRRTFLLGSGALAAIGVVGQGLAVAARAGASTPVALPAGLSSLDIFAPGFPRGFYFRTMEDDALAGTAYSTWKTRWSQLDGVMAHLFNDVYPGNLATSRSFVNRLKADLPGQVCMLHINGHGRIPTFQINDFFAGHWVYREGTTLTAAATSSATVLQVADGTKFSADNGANHIGDDICIAKQTGGVVDWNTSEQVRLISISGNSLTVQRARYNSTAIALSAGWRVVPHYGHIQDSGQDPTVADNWQWYYNYATTCPLDSTGRSASDAFVAELAGFFAVGGVLEGLDGLEFDIYSYQIDPGVDIDNDGVADGGEIGGVNVYGQGTLAFQQSLRNALGPDRLIMMDNGSGGQRPNYVALNGVESEGWPSIEDVTFEDWSRGINRQQFWQDTSAEPRFNYLNYKYRGETITDFTHLRMMTAATALTGSILAEYDRVRTSGNPVAETYDELDPGGLGNLHWLGEPVAEAVHLAAGTTDLLGGNGITWPNAYRTAIVPSGCYRSVITRTNGDISLALTNNSAPVATQWRGGIEGVTPRPPLLGPAMTVFGVTLPDITITGTDLYLQCEFDGPDLDANFPGAARLVLIRVNWTDSGGPKTRMSYTWVNTARRFSTFYFRGLAAGPISVVVTAECGGKPLYMTKLSAHAAPDATYREFDNGIVLANPSNAAYTFNLATLFPGATFTRLAGRADQDPTTNNGAAAGSSVSLPARDALFLARD